MIVVFLVFRGLEQCCEMLRQTWPKSSGLESLTGGRQVPVRELEGVGQSHGRLYRLL